MPRKPRLVDLLSDRKRPRPFVTQDGTMIVRGESYPIVGDPLAMDERPKPSGRPVTFDGATPSPED